MLNHITVMGRLTRDPELKETPSGVSVCSFSLACDRDFKDKGTGEKTTDFIDCVAWRSTAEFIAKYFAKGRTAVVDGRLQIRSYTDREGNKRRAAEIIVSSVYFGDTKPKNEGNGEPPAYTDSDYDIPDAFEPDLGAGEDDGDCPF